MLGIDVLLEAVAQISAGHAQRSPQNPPETPTRGRPPSCCDANARWSALLTAARVMPAVDARSLLSTGRRIFVFSRQSWRMSVDKLPW